MPKRSSKDRNETAFSIVQQATKQIYPKPFVEASYMAQDARPPSSKNPHAQALGRLGGLKGGKARAAKLSPEERSQIAKKAAKSRWKTKKGA